MPDMKSDNALMALLGLESDTPASTAATTHRPEAAELPNLNQRVEMLLRALHGAGREFTPAERSSARAQLLAEIAASMMASRSSVLKTANDVTNQAMSAREYNSLDNSMSYTDVIAKKIKLMFEGLLRDALFPFSSSYALAGRRLQFAAIPFALLLLAGGGWSAAWFYAAQIVEYRFADSGGPDTQVGHGYVCGSRTTSGFPFRVELQCDAPTATVASRQGPLVVKAAQLRAIAEVYRPYSATAEIVGPITIAVHGRTAVAIANGNLNLDQNGQIDGTLNVTTTVAGLQELAASFGSDQDTRDRVAVLAQNSIRNVPNGLDNAAPLSADATATDQKTIDVPVHVSTGSLSIGSLAIGRIPPLFGDADPGRSSR
jgi:hypothetical protein